MRKILLIPLLIICSCNKTKEKHYYDVTWEYSRDTYTYTCYYYEKEYRSAKVSINNTHYVIDSYGVDYPRYNNELIVAKRNTLIFYSYEY